jgi:outer membrane protein OmpA-like peptidoglycan-associated protein
MQKDSTMNRKLLIGAVGCMALLGACSSQRAQTQQSQSGTDFSRELARQYHGFAAQQRVEAYDYGSSGFFDRKGDIAAKGTVVPPEVPGKQFNALNRDVRPDLTSAHDRLTTALNSPATQRATTPLARAQVRYDCWLESTDDPNWAVKGEWLSQKNRECRSEFESAMAEVDTAMRPAPVAAAPTPREQSLLVFFDFDRYQITPEGEQVIQRVVENYRRGGSATIVATGHADRAGPEDHNMALSDRRANAVQAALLQAGVSVPINTVARGEEQPLVPTPDGEREPQNRRVEIKLQ